jgi:NAD(P)-dependent dehydrogenase (short-subunit alcohol dehydrogenase family)
MCRGRWHEHREGEKMTPARFTLTLCLILCELCRVSAARAETVLITGANSGIGLEFAKEYATRGWTVIATHRRTEVPKPLSDLAKQFPKTRIEQLDVTNVEQAKALASKLGNVPIDVLINNAGVYNERAGCASEDESCPGDWSTQRFGNLKYSLFDTIMAVNVKGPLIVSEAFLKNVRASALKKMVAVSSSNGSLTGPIGPPPGAIFYRSSKAALNRSMQLVAQALKDDGVTVIMLNPGPTLTERQSYLKQVPGMLTTQFTVENMVRTIDNATLKDTGKFLRYDGVPEAW